jgi:hypothetical protein
MAPEQAIQAIIQLAVTIYRENLQDFISARWRLFRKARTEDLKALTHRELGLYGEKKTWPDPIHRETVRTLIALIPVLLVLTFLKDRPWAMWSATALFYGVMLRLLLVLAILTGYRLKLLPRFLAQGR